uniref:methylmalonate-semialdehyde dehydrogenase (CoA acylating) n=1 Tax=Albugo laibachii Nc14 TaxID=890382 RepID=F0WPR4_9STRA|nr:methylmalonate semialdehyde dehydrogenase putative [Albugo laibachii Nc14]CCA24349.1 methylmalonate semialdehyde dehydrogenase putative [Albugo laibachii Nc14]|eukprot:CCA24349.1 methylmalonate semialdehyde dehydrogenase putative [Albugo laibachii Nc14]
METSKRMKTGVPRIDNLIGDQFVAPKTSQYIDVISPTDDRVIATCALSSAEDVDHAVQIASLTFQEWKTLTVKARATILHKFYALMSEHAGELADLIVLESGKNRVEALASVYKGIETIEYACSLPQLIQGKILQVSREITCHEIREPLGVIVSIVPFNFPVMVPMWTIPIALALGNCVILKPSEKVPMTMHRTAQLLQQAGVPPGAFQIINGKEKAVNRLCDHPQVAAVTFVGSSRVAQTIARRCRAIDKRVLALGGAKNHLVAAVDAQAEMTAQDIVTSYAGCAGQRCMAASVLLLVGDREDILKLVVKKSKELTRGVEKGQVGALIDSDAKVRVLRYIDEAESSGAIVLVDGRSWATEPKGNWVGPTVLLHKSADDPAMKEEIFGPVLSVFKVQTNEDALDIVNSSEYGNAACVYTMKGETAEYFQTRFRAGMIGVNVGIPVPREPFSFGGLYGTKSKYGDVDITGDGCVEFFSNRRKVTTKWSLVKSNEDKANFTGQM